MAVATALLVVGCASQPLEHPAGVGPPASAPPGTTTDDRVPPELATFAASWPAPGRDLTGSRAVLDSPITRDSIGTLAEAWRVDLPGVGGYGNAASGPLIVGDTVIVQELTSTVRAVDVSTGVPTWTASYSLPTVGPNGPAVGYGKVFANKGAKEVMALDLKTGKELWTSPVTATPTEGIDIQPQVFDGLVFVSSVPVSIAGIYTGGDRGVLQALDAETGQVRWTFDTVKGDDVWGNSEVNSGGGAWMTPSIDVASGTIYWGVANPAPFPGTPELPNGSSRPGPNLYTDSVVALDARTGELKWFHQAVEHDLFDRDLTHTMVVTDRDGHEVIVGTGKMGRVIGLDPGTGELRWDTPVGRHQNDELTELSGPTEVYPGTYGGVLTPPAAADGVVYTAVINAPSTLSPDTPSYIGSDLGKGPGAMVAVDAADGHVLWSSEVPGDPLGGATVLGDLVLTGTAEGVLVAYDRATGEQVWTLSAPGGLNGWPAAAGDTLVWPIGLAKPATLVAYRLGR